MVKTERPVSQLRKLAKKYGVRTMKKTGGKKVYKSSAVIKRSIALKRRSRVRSSTKRTVRRRSSRRTVRRRSSTKRPVRRRSSRRTVRRRSSRRTVRRRSRMGYSCSGYGGSMPGSLSMGPYSSHFAAPAVSRPKPVPMPVLLKDPIVVSSNGVVSFGGRSAASVKRVIRRLKECKPTQIRNPQTRRCVNRNGKIGKEILGYVKEPCKPTQMRNPHTRRCVNQNGKIGKEILAYYDFIEKLQKEGVI